MAVQAECVASVLRRSWKPTPPVFSGTEAELAFAAHILFATGAASLAWWKIRHTDLAATPIGKELCNAFRLHALDAAMRVQAIKTILPALRAAGVEPLLVKGWAAAGYYPNAALRPYGDIDLCVTDLATAADILAPEPLSQFNVDLHRGGEHLIDVEFDTVVAQSRLVDLEGIAVRIPSEEHHLRILCLHLLYHGAWRPLWLCDIGAALDAASDDFDWDAFLGSDPIRARWMVCTLRLAESLLGADLSRTPAKVRTAALPHWIERATLREWTRSHRWTSGRTIGAAIATRPWAAAFEIARRWPDPIRASVAYEAPFDRGWRAPYQLRYSCSRFGKVVKQVMESGRRPASPSATIGDASSKTRTDDGAHS